MVKSFVDSTSSKSTSKNNIAPLFNFEAQLMRSSSSKEILDENHALDFILKTLKRLKTPTVVMMQCLWLMMMMMNGRDSAWADPGIYSKDSSALLSVLTEPDVSSMPDHKIERPMKKLHKSSSGADRVKQAKKQKQADPSPVYFFIFLFIVMAFHVVVFLSIRPPSSIIMVQVGLSVSNPSLHKDFRHILKTMESPECRYRYVLEAVVDLILRHSKDWICCYSSVNEKYIPTEATKWYNELLKGEDKDSNEEKLPDMINLNQSDRPYSVIVLFVKKDGWIELPTITDSGDLKAALKELLTACTLQRVDVRKFDFKSLERCLEYYPKLKPLSYKMFALFNK